MSSYFMRQENYNKHWNSRRPPLLDNIWYIARICVLHTFSVPAYLPKFYTIDLWKLYMQERYVCFISNLFDTFKEERYQQRFFVNSLDACAIAKRQISGVIKNAGVYHDILPYSAQAFFFIHCVYIYFNHLTM